MRNFSQFASPQGFLRGRKVSFQNLSTRDLSHLSGLCPFAAKHSNWWVKGALANQESIGGTNCVDGQRSPVRLNLQTLPLRVLDEGANPREKVEGNDAGALIKVHTLRRLLLSRTFTFSFFLAFSFLFLSKKLPMFTLPIKTAII